MDFKEDFIEALQEELYQKGTEVRLDSKAVEKREGEDYDAVIVTPVDSNIGVTLNVEPYFQAYEDGIAISEHTSEASAMGGTPE